MRHQLNLHVPDMTCGHCSAAVTAAVKALDPAASVTVDLPAKRLQLETTATREDVLQSLDDAGFTAQSHPL